jgi:hypothetical protein
MVTSELDAEELRDFAKKHKQKKGDMNDNR